MHLFMNSQLKRLSNIFDNAGQVLLGTLVLSPVLSTPEASLVLLGISMTVLYSGFLSLKLERIAP
jgi:hypothetical protein